MYIIMKKSLFILASVAVMFSACTQEVLVDESAKTATQKPFAFSTFSEKVTRADSHSNLEFFYPTFNVYGWKKLQGKSAFETEPVFNDVTNEHFADNTSNGTVVYKSELPSTEWGTIQSFPAWFYEGIRYWDKFATDYRFSAYTPIDASAQVTCTSDGVIKFGTSASKVTVETTNLMATPATELAYTGFTTDFMTATSTAQTSAVNLVFNHEFAKFNVKLVKETSLTTKQDVVVNEVSLKNLNGSSYYDSSNESATGFVTGWANPTTEIAYEAKGVGTATTGYKLNGTTAGTDNFDGYYVMERLMVPQTALKAVDGTGNPVNAQLAEFTEPCVYVKYTIGSEIFEGHYSLANIFLGTSTEASYNFEGGKEYTLTITVGPLPIYFTTTVTTWTNVDGAIAAN